jgi:hypothetical protein
VTAIVLASIGGYSGQTSWDAGTDSTTIAIGGTGLLFLPPLLMIVFRQKYPRSWFDWNRELLRFINRVGISKSAELTATSAAATICCSLQTAWAL